MNRDLTGSPRDGLLPPHRSLVYLGGCSQQSRRPFVIQEGTRVGGSVHVCDGGCSFTIQLVELFFFRIFLYFYALFMKS